LKKAKKSLIFHQKTAKNREKSLFFDCFFETGFSYKQGVA